MKKHFFLIAALAAVLVAFTGCKDDVNSNGADGPDNGGKSGKVLSPEETKQEMMNIANGLIGKFHTEDQKAAVELADGMYEKYENYDFEGIGNYFETRYDELFRLPKYVCAVAEGGNPVPAMNHAYTFSFAGESVIWEADEANRTWKNMGPASDNSIIMRAKDKNGTMCEAKFWGEGAEKTYSYTWTEGGESHTATGVLPAIVHFTLKQGSTLIMSADLQQDLQKNNHATFNLAASVVNLRWTTDINIRSTNASLGFAFYYGSESLLSALINLPSYKLIDKQDSQSYEDWIEQYEERYEELIRQIGGADAVIDINGKAQIKAVVSNAGQAYNSIMNMQNQGVDPESQQGAEQYCNIINNAQSNGVYIGNATQAEVRVIAMSETDSYYGESYYWPEPVLYFSADGTTYAFEQYFEQNRQPFTDLKNSAENLVNAYIHLSSWLSQEVGDIDF